MLRRILLLTVLSGCTTGDGTSTYMRTDGGPADDDEGVADACDAPSVQLTNSTGLTLTQIQYGTCDTMSATYPLFGADLGPGETRSAELPTPDCYFIVLAAAGCQFEAPIEAGPLDACELFSFTVTADLFLCSGGP